MDKTQPFFDPYNFNTNTNFQDPSQIGSRGELPQTHIHPRTKEDDDGNEPEHPVHRRETMAVASGC